jgi:hypothetical protein
VVLTSIAIYFVTVLDVSIVVLTKIDSIRRAFLWVRCEKVFGRKCKVNRELVYKPGEYGSLGIFKLKMFASALRL